MLYFTCHPAKLFLLQIHLCHNRGCEWCESVEACCNCPVSTLCFPATATVNLANGTSTNMSQLRKGDKVQTGRFSSFFLFHINPFSILDGLQFSCFELLVVSCLRFKVRDALALAFSGPSMTFIDLLASSD